MLCSIPHGGASRHAFLTDLFLKADLCSHFERFLHMVIDNYGERHFVSLSMVERGASRDATGAFYRQ